MMSKTLAITFVLLASPLAFASGSPAPQDATQQETVAPSSAVSPVIGERLLIANGYFEKNRLDDALATVDELLRVRKLSAADVAQIHRFRGYILLAKGDSDAAIVELEAALAAGALDETARQALMYSLAQLYTQAGKVDKAREVIDRWFASAADPKPEAYFLKAMILVQQEAWSEAVEPARTAIARSTQARESWLQLLAAIEFQLQDYAALAGTLRQLVAVAPSTKRYWVQLATIENSLGKDAEALASIGIAHEAGLLSEDREIRQRARMCFAREMPSCCVETLEQGMEAGVVKGDAESYRLLANCLIAGRETGRAMEPLAKAGDLGDGARSFLLLGQLQLQREEFDDARQSLQKALVHAPAAERSSVELLLGIAHLGSKRFDEAEKSFRVALGNEKTRPAADSYMKHLEQQRARLRQRETNAVAGSTEPAPDPEVADAASNRTSM